MERLVEKNATLRSRRACYTPVSHICRYTRPVVHGATVRGRLPRLPRRSLRRRPRPRTAPGNPGPIGRPHRRPTAPPRLRAPMPRRCDSARHVSDISMFGKGSGRGPRRFAVGSCRALTASEPPRKPVLAGRGVVWCPTVHRGRGPADTATLPRTIRLRPTRQALSTQLEAGIRRTHQRWPTQQTPMYHAL
jgi:hypothetical protein